MSLVNKTILMILRIFQAKQRKAASNPQVVMLYPVFHQPWPTAVSSLIEIRRRISVPEATHTVLSCSRSCGSPSPGYWPRPRRPTSFGLVAALLAERLEAERLSPLQVLEELLVVPHPWRQWRGLLHCYRSEKAPVTKGQQWLTSNRLHSLRSSSVLKKLLAGCS